MTEAQWLAKRKMGITGSDIAAIMGLNPWKTREQVYLDKIGQGKPFTGNDATRAGQRLEHPISSFWSKTNQIIITQGEFTAHPEEPLFIGTPDFLHPFGGLEIKTGVEGTFKKGCPVYYEYQSRWYMMLTQRKRWDLLACLVPKDRSLIPPDGEVWEWLPFQPMRDYRFERDLNIEEAMKLSAYRFIDDYFPHWRIK